MAFGPYAALFHPSAKLCAVTGSPLWNFCPALTLIVQTFWSSDVTDSAASGTALPSAVSVIRLSNSSVITSKE